MILVGGGSSLADAVVPVVAGAGVSLRRQESPTADGWDGDAPWEGAASVVLWWAGLPQPPPAGAVLVDVDHSRLWAAAARAPGHRAVVLPVGRAWLAEHLGGTVRWGGRGPGRVLLVGGLGEAQHSAKVARELARAAREGGMETVLVDADPRGSLRFLGVEGPSNAREVGAGRRAGARGPAVGGSGSGGSGSGTGSGAEAWWPDALAWARDGAAHALIGALPQWRGVPLLTWNVLAEGASVEGVGAESGAESRTESRAEPTVSAGGGWPSAASFEVVAALARGTELVVVDAGPLGWPMGALPRGPAASSPVSELVLCAGHGAPWDQRWWLDAAGPGLPRGVQGSLVTVRSQRLPVDGPFAAEALGVGWAGTLDLRAGRGGEGGLRRAGRRRMQRHWLPRLRRGVALGAEA